MKKILFVLLLLTSLTACKDKGCDERANLDVDQTQLAADIAAIDFYLQTNGIQAEEHPSGLRIVVRDEGDGASIDICDVVFAKYEGRITSSQRVFDDGDQRVQSFNLSFLVEGWKIALPEYRQGADITIYIPSVYGYGETGNSGAGIDPNTNIEFDIEVVLVD